MMTPILSTAHLAIGYASGRKTLKRVASDLALEIPAGELICLLGPNGAGKSTLLRTIAGVQKPLEGIVLLNGTDVHRMKPAQLAQNLSLVLTERVDTGMLTGYALVALGRHPYTDWSGRLTDDDIAIVQGAVTAVGAEALAPRLLHEMSDGERQKLMIARALAQEPLLLILDEPTAYLDLPRRVEIMHLLRQLAHDTGRAILLSTHDLDLALRTADRLWLMSKGGVVQTGAPEDLVLSGAFECTFASEGLVFDKAEGTFRIGVSATHHVVVRGDGLAARWTIRSLQRAGYAVLSATHEQDSEVAVTVSDSTLGWQVNAGGHVRQISSIESLLAVLKHIFA